MYPGAGFRKRDHRSSGWRLPNIEKGTAWLVYRARMKGRAGLVILGLVVLSCTGGADPATTMATIDRGSSTTVSVTTQPTAPPSTTPMVPIVDSSVLPDGPCAIDTVPGGGEATVLIGDRLYGLGADLATPRCLLEGVLGTDVEWGPAADRVRIGTSVYGADFETLTFDEGTRLEWTAPTGNRVVVISADNVTKVPLDGSENLNITFLDQTDSVAYHPAGTHLLAVGTDVFGQYGLWFASNDGVNFVLVAFDEEATIADPVWSWLNEPLFVARHRDGRTHVHRVELVDGNFEGPILVETSDEIDLLMASAFDPMMMAYRLRGEAGARCVEGSSAAVSGVDLPQPLASYTSTPVGWLSAERLLVLAFPDGCDSPGDLWWFSAGFCPGSTYGAELLITGVDGAAARESFPVAPPSPDFTGVIDPAPA